MDARSRSRRCRVPMVASAACVVAAVVAADPVRINVIGVRIAVFQTDPAEVASEAQRDGLAPSAWPSGETIAIVSTVLTVGVGIGAMVFASTWSIRGEISNIRGKVDGLATKLEDTHRSLTAGINATRLELSAKIEGLDARLRVVEKDVSGIQALGARHPVTQGASLSDLEDDADA